MASQARSQCERCGTALAASMLACPSCHQLVWADHAESAAGAAREAESAGDIEKARQYWAAALSYLPPESVQHQTIARHVAQLAPVAPAAPKTNWRKLFGPVGVAALVVWKFKAILLAVLSKGKLLLFGVSKAGTLVSMFASFGLYLTLYTWKFALGLVVSIWIHEMGHVAAFRRYGIAVSAPMFLPGLGAYVRGQGMGATVGEQARIALAGPVWGMAASLIALAIASQTRDPMWTALATVGAQINLLNLIPISILDGERATAALTNKQRITVAVAIALLWYLTGVGMYFLLLCGFGYRLWKRDADQTGDTGVLIQLVGLAAVLGILSLVPVDTGVIRGRQ